MDQVAIRSQVGARSSWLTALWVGVLLLIAYGPSLSGIAGSWFDETADMGHGVFVPVAAGYMIWLKRETLRRIPKQPKAWGLIFVGWAAIQAIFGTVAQWVWFTRTAFLIALVGCLITIYGVRTVAELAYPLATMVLMITPPTFIFERITLPLQLLASRLGELSLEGLGYSVLREGNILELVGERLAVEEACSGIRSLMALFFLCIVYAYFFVPEKVVRAILLVAVIPIAIVCNAGRIVATGVVGQYNRELAHGMLHDAFGHFGLVLGAIMCFILHRAVIKVRDIRNPRYV